MNPNDPTWLSERNLYLFGNNNSLINIDKDGRLAVTVYVSIYAIGRGIGHIITACIECHTCHKCWDNTDKLMNKYIQNHKPLEVQQYLKSAKPGSECAAPCAACGEEVLYSAKWLVGGVLIKYAITPIGRSI